DVVEAAAKALTGGEPACLLLGGAALGEAGLRTAGRIAAATGCALMVETFPARLERGGGLPSPTRLPYFPEQAVQALAPYRQLVLAGAADPVAFFGYRGMASSTVPPSTQACVLASPDADALAALAALADRVGARQEGPPASAGDRPELPPASPLDPVTIGAVLAALQPDGAIIVDEANTTGLPYNGIADSAPRHSYLSLTGGAIGQGPPVATGASLACPDRPVIDFQADGSFLYTMQALWTQAREGLDVTTLVCANRVYRILQAELWRAGVSEPGPVARGLTDLGSPTIDFAAISRGLGVPASTAATTTELAEQLQRALGEPGPHLVEMVM
ncbi:MAG: acetolactate synthase large subunit, partial [Actinomycetota bacterium]|nr:acetolactate synthase large subunit [Actinomycetota bacterium]